MCEVCRGTLPLEHREVRFSRGQGRYVLHARCVVEDFARGAASAPLHCPAVNSGAQHPRRDALEAAIQEPRVFTIGSRGWEGGPQATRAYAAG